MKKLIIVDDDPGIQDAISLVFRAPSYEVTIFDSADPVLSGAYEIPDLFILDKQLSGVDGLELCKHLKSMDKTRNVPVILVSASPNVLNMSKICGAEAAIEKPFRSKDLRAMVEMLLNR